MWRKHRNRDRLSLILKEKCQKYISKCKKLRIYTCTNRHDSKKINDHQVKKKIEQVHVK